ncbi:MAG: hypothetical protein Q8O67_17080 [Deltaproteobacteria bacterium]|nr:hypothetical protein [Deltaproteobacteria bacterium]
MTQREYGNIYLHGLLERHIKPHADSIATIFGEGLIAVLVVAPTGEAVAAARKLGWDGTTPVFPLSTSGAAALATASSDAARWVRRVGAGRIFVLDGNGSLLVNFGDQGFSLEPGSLDTPLPN